MNSLVAASIGTVGQVPSGLEEKLQWLRRFGQPRLTFHTDGWCGTIDMHVAAVGAEFTVRSEFKHATPTEAIDTCIQRMLESLALIAKGGS